MPSYIRELLVQLKDLNGDLSPCGHGSLADLLQDGTAEEYEFLVLLLLLAGTRLRTNGGRTIVFVLILFGLFIIIFLGVVAVLIFIIIEIEGIV